MSAFTVDIAHIDTIVNAARHLLPANERQAYAPAMPNIGQMLWAENFASVNYRYSEREDVPAYVPTFTDEELSPVAVLKAIDCYEYQSCEHPAWEASDAKRFVDAVRGLIYRDHPDLARPVPQRHDRTRTEAAYRQLPEYDAAPWEVTSLDQVAAVIVKAEREQAVKAEQHRGEGAVYREVGRLDVVEVAKRMRVNLTNTQAAGMLPAGAKFSVTTERFAGGSSVTVTVKGMPDSWLYTTTDRHGFEERIYTDAAMATRQAIEDMLSAYNRDRSDSQTDYFDVSFYQSVNFQDEREAKWWAAEKERKAKRAAARKARRVR